MINWIKGIFPSWVNDPFKRECHKRQITAGMTQGLSGIRIQGTNDLVVSSLLVARDIRGK